MTAKFSNCCVAVSFLMSAVCAYSPVRADPPDAATQPSRQATQVVVRYDDGTEQVLAAANGQSPPAAAAVVKLPDEVISYGLPMADNALHVNALMIPKVAADPMNARCEWDFGDAGPTSRYNVLPGWTAAHFYDRAGDYTLALRLTDAAGQPTIYARQITVAPDARMTYYVAADGNDDNSGNKQDKPVTFAKLIRIMGDNTRILLRRGDKFEVSKSIQPVFKNVVIGAYGEPAAERPVLNYVGPQDFSAIVQLSMYSRGVTLENIHFTTSLGQGNTDKTEDAIHPAGWNLTVRNCRFSDISNALNCNGTPHGVLVMDNVAPGPADVRAFFSWMEGQDHVYLGNTVGNSTREHIIRGMGYTRVLCYGNDVANLDRRPGDPLDYTKSAFNFQNGSYVYCAHNTVRGGPIAAGPLGGADGGDPAVTSALRTRYVVIEDNVVSGTSGLIGAAPGAEDVVVRHNTVYGDDRMCFSIAGFDGKYNRGPLRITFENNLGINNGTQGQFIRQESAGAKAVRVSGNVYVAPKLVFGPYETAILFLHDPVSADPAGNAAFTVTGNTFPDRQPYNGGVILGGNEGNPSDWKPASALPGNTFRNVSEQEAKVLGAGASR
jgi:hypothetical protein